MPRTVRSSADDGRNPLALEYNKLLLQQADRNWIARMCQEYGTSCAQPFCEYPASELFVSLYSCSFICAAHAEATSGAAVANRARRVVLCDEIDIDLYGDFMSRTLGRYAELTNGSVVQLSKAQAKELRKLDEMQRDAEYKARMEIRNRARKGTSGDPYRANVVHLTEVDGREWAAIEFDPRQGLDKVVLPATLVTKKKFAPEVNASNETGLTVEDLF